MVSKHDISTFVYGNVFSCHEESVQHVILIHVKIMAVNALILRMVWP